MNEEIKIQITNKLNEKGPVLPCPRCGNGGFVMVEEENVPEFINIICPYCGYYFSHHYETLMKDATKIEITPSYDIHYKVQEMTRNIIDREIWSLKEKINELISHHVDEYFATRSHKEEAVEIKDNEFINKIETNHE